MILYRLCALLTCFVPLIFVSSVSAASVSVLFENSMPEDAKHVVVFVDNIEQLSGAAAAINNASNGQVVKALIAQKFTPKKHSIVTLYGLGDTDRLLVVGTSAGALDTKVDLHNLGGKIAKHVGVALEGANVIVDASNLSSAMTSPTAHLVFGYLLQNYRFEKYKSRKVSTSGYLVMISDDALQASETYNNDLAHVATGVYLTRDLSTEPGKTIFPESFVERVKRQFKGVKNVKIDVLNVRDMRKHNMGALLGVGQGSIHDPRLMVIEYNGGEKGEAPIALAGKGITFDTGGISIKGNTNMWLMKSDTAGAAAVAGTMYAIAKRGENVNVVGLMAMAENMPAEDAIRPGDVLKTMQGTTIEILSTDAEGRLVLADAVYYAQQKYAPKMLVNIATLTGSAARALGDEYAVVITRDWDLSVDMMGIGKRSGENVWPLPLHPNHFKQIKSDIADIKNSGAGSPGASIGAAVIGTFVDQELPWVHLDIAGVDWITDATDTMPKGSSGWGVRFMDQLIRERK